MNYGDMKSTFESILNRTDLTASDTSRCFSLAVADIQSRLRVPDMEKTLTVDTSAASVDSVTIPTDYLQMISFVHPNTVGGPDTLQRLDKGSFFKLLPSEYPKAYIRDTGAWKVRGSIPQDGEAYVYYYGKLDALVNDADEPWYAELHPLMVIYGALALSGSIFLDERRPEWLQNYEGYLAMAQDRGIAEDMHMGWLAIRPAYSFDDGA